MEAQVNAAAGRVPIEVESLDDFNELRRQWSDKRPVPLILGPEDGERIRFPGQDARLLVGGEQSSGRFAIFEVVVDPNFGAPYHHQSNEDEWWYILEGELEIGVGDQVRSVGPGSSAYAPARCQHTFSNKTDTPVKLITINSPAGHERFFEALSRSSDKTDEQRRSLTEAHDVVFGKQVVLG